MPLTLVIASIHVSASVFNDSKRLKDCETAKEYKGEKIGQARAMETLGIAASFASTNPVQPSPRLLHNGHTVTQRCIR